MSVRLKYWTSKKSEDGEKKKDEPRWQADFYAYGIRKTKVFRAKKDAIAYEGKILAAIKENRYFDIKKEAFETFKQLSEWYLSLEDVMRKKSFARDERSAGKLAEFFGSLLIPEITPEKIGEYQKKRQGEKSYRKHATMPATINRETDCLRGMFGRAIKNGKLEKNPVSSIKRLQENNIRERVLSPGEWEKYKTSCPPWYLPIAMMGYFAGMRKAEIINQVESRVDLKEGFITLRPEDTKTKEGRLIPIHRELLGVLERAMTGKVKLIGGQVFHRDGEPVTENDIRSAHETACRKSGISGFNFHDFRHTCLNNWRKDGHDYFKIMAASGHKTISVFKRYNMVDKEELKTLVGVTRSEQMVKNPGQQSEEPSELPQKSSMVIGA